MAKLTYTNEIRLKYPKKAKSADYGGSRTNAIHIFCYACVGTSHEARKCISYSCPLWKFRPGSDNKPAPKGKIPSEEEYDELIADGKEDAE